jgi:hypothetical protein
MTWDSRGKTAVVGIGTSQLSRKAEKPLGLLALDACRAAMEDAGIDPAEVDGIVTYPDQPFLGAGNRDGEDLVSVNFLIDHGGERSCRGNLQLRPCLARNARPGRHLWCVAQQQGRR